MALVVTSHDVSDDGVSVNLLRELLRTQGYNWGENVRCRFTPQVLLQILR